MNNDSQNALHTEIFSSAPISGTSTNPAPKYEIISKNDSYSCKISPVVSFRISGIEKGGRENDGRPSGMSPLILNQNMFRL